MHHHKNTPMKRAPMHRGEFHTVDNAEKSDAADTH